MTANHDSSLRLIRPLSWAEVFSDWEEREGSNPQWTKVATEVKGWPDWKSWRIFTAQQLRLPDRDWSLYEITNPAGVIPAMLLGPYTGWQSRVPTPNTHSFADLVAIPTQAADWSSRPDIVRMGNTFPSPTTMIGLRRLDGRIVLVEGHHRAVAIALAASQGKTTAFDDVFLHLADLGTDEDRLLDTTLSRGSTKEPPK